MDTTIHNDQIATEAAKAELALGVEGILDNFLLYNGDDEATRESTIAVYMNEVLPSFIAEYKEGAEYLSDYTVLDAYGEIYLAYKGDGSRPEPSEVYALVAEFGKIKAKSQGYSLDSTIEIYETVVKSKLNENLASIGMAL